MPTIISAILTLLQPAASAAAVGVFCQAQPFDISQVRFSTFELIRYYSYIFIAQFADYPWVVRVSYAMVVFGIMFIVFLLGLAIWRNYTQTRIQKFHDRIVKYYHDDFSSLCALDTQLKSNDVYRVFQEHKLSNTANKAYRQRAWIRYLVNLRETAMKETNDSFGLDTDNLSYCVSLLGLPAFLEKKIRFGSKRTKASWIHAAEYLNITLPESTLSRDLASKNAMLRLCADIYFMRRSENDAYRFLENGQISWSRFMMIEIHETFVQRQREGQPLPSLLPLISVQRDPRVAAFLINEVATFGSDDDVEAIISYFGNRDVMMRRAAFICVGQRKYKPAIEPLKDAFMFQGEAGKRIVLDSIAKIDAEGSIDFFESAYRATTSVFTDEVALRCLLKAGDAGRARFEELRAEVLDADEDDLLFRHVENDLIERDFIMTDIHF